MQKRKIELLEELVSILYRMKDDSGLSYPPSKFVKDVNRTEEIEEQLASLPKEQSVTDEEISIKLDSMNFETSKEREDAWDLCIWLCSRLTGSETNKTEVMKKPTHITMDDLEKSDPGNLPDPATCFFYDEAQGRYYCCNSEIESKRCIGSDCGGHEKMKRK